MTPIVAPQPFPIISRLIKPLEVLSAALLVIIIVLLFVGVVARYVFSLPIVWIDEVVSMSFLWLAMLGTAIAMHRNEHLRLSLFLDMMPKKIQGFVHAQIGTLRQCNQQELYKLLQLLNEEVANSQ